MWRCVVVVEWNENSNFFFFIFKVFFFLSFFSRIHSVHSQMKLDIFVTCK